jgi:ATP-dependent helicase HrpA
MIVAARDEGCLREVLVIAAALSVQDPRERPQERQGTADAAHKKFADEKSEFLSWLKLWQWYEGESSTRNRSASWCRPATRTSSRRCACASGATSTASCTRWRRARWKENQIPATYDAIHRALLAGLLGNIGCKSEDSAITSARAASSS